MRAGRRRRRLRAVIEVEEDGETSRRRAGPGWKPGANGETAERRNRIDRTAVASSRAFCDDLRLVLADASDGSLFVGPASGRRAAPLSRPLRAGDRPGSRRADLAVPTGLRGRTGPLEEGGRNAPWLEAIEREASTRRRGRRGAARLRAPARALIEAERDDPRPFLGEARAGWRDRGHHRSGRRSRPKTATGRACATIAAATSPPAAPDRPASLRSLVWHGPEQSSPAAAILDRRAEGADRRAGARPMRGWSARCRGSPARAPRRDRGRFRSVPPRRAVRRARAPRRPGVPHRRRPAVFAWKLDETSRCLRSRRRRGCGRPRPSAHERETVAAISGPF